jgi:hypothetical protein
MTLSCKDFLLEKKKRKKKKEKTKKTAFWYGVPIGLLAPSR